MLTAPTRTRLCDAHGSELRALLAPVTPETFVRDYWAKKPLFVKGFRDKYAGFFGAEDFSRALAVHRPGDDDFLRVSFDRKTDDGRSISAAGGELRSQAFRASADQAVPLFDAGATLCVSQIETRVPSLVPFIAAIKRQLGYPGKVAFNAYLSPPGSGFNWHFDSRIASTLQIEGSKRWRFSHEPAIPWPRGNGSVRADGSGAYTDPTIVAQAWERFAPLDETQTTEVLLEPGDLLILPAGVWHEACGGSGGSLALNLSFTAVSYTVLVRNLLETVLTPEAGWRGPAPVLPTDEPGCVDPAGVAEISAQLARAAAVLGSLSGDSAAVVRLWQSLVHQANPGLPPPPPAPIVATPVRPDERLRLRADGEISARLADGGSRLCVAVGASRTIELGGSAIRFVLRILAEREFVAGDALGWSDAGTANWTDVAATLTKLKREGLIEPAPAATGTVSGG
jgi:hypothetical protein